MSPSEKREADLKKKSYRLEVWKTVIAGFGVFATAIAGATFFLNYRSAEENIRLTQQNIGLTQQNTKLTEERLITDRFSKAVEQIGSDKNKEEVILGGIYSLERIAKDSPKDQWTIVEVLTSFVRKNSPIETENAQIKDKKVLQISNPMNITVEAALTVIGRRNAENDEINLTSAKKSNTINLSRVNLSRLDLGGSYFPGEHGEVDEVGGNLQRSNLMRSNLMGANLSATDLQGSDLRNTNLQGANLGGSNLSNTNLLGANMSNTHLEGTNLSKADLTGVNLDGAILEFTNLYEVTGISPSKLKELEKRGAIFKNKETE